MDFEDIVLRIFGGMMLIFACCTLAALTIMLFKAALGGLA